MKKTIACVVGARPNFMKIAPILEAIRSRDRFTGRLIHTGQHFSPELSESFFHDLGIPEPDENLGVAPGTPTAQTAEMLRLLEKSFLEHRPDLILIVGDVTSTLAAALAGVRMGIQVAHVEAGLRSFDRTMPEEINRLVTDTLSDYLFVSEPSGLLNLKAEGVAEDKIFFVGNVMIDTLLRHRERALQSGILDRLQLQPDSYAVATLHRPANVDDLARLRGLIDALRSLATRLPIVFPVHPRTQSRIAAAQIPTDGLILTPPLGYLDFLRLMCSAKLLLTDSGGIQEETTILGVPCLTLRDNTERPVTIEQGTNRLIGTDPANLLPAAIAALDAGPVTTRAPQFWDGHASTRILDILESKLDPV